MPTRQGGTIRPADLCRHPKGHEEDGSKAAPEPRRPKVVPDETGRRRDVLVNQLPSDPAHQDAEHQHQAPEDEGEADAVALRDETFPALAPRDVRAHQDAQTRGTRRRSRHEIADLWTRLFDVATTISPPLLCCFRAPPSCSRARRVVGHEARSTPYPSPPRREPRGLEALRSRGHRAIGERQPLSLRVVDQDVREGLESRLPPMNGSRLQDGRV